MLDAFAAEPQFLDHLAPVWLALPSELRGTFYVHAPLLDRAHQLGIDATAFDATRARAGSPPRARAPQGPKALVASIGDTKIARRRGYGDFARLEHGCGQTYKGNSTGSYAGGPDNDDASLVIVPNEYSAGHWRRAYPLARVEVVGSPRIEGLPRRELAPLSEADWEKERADAELTGRMPSHYADKELEPVIAVTFHWNCGVAQETRPAMEFVAALPALAKRYTVLGHQHPKWDSDDHYSPAAYYRRYGIEFVPDFEDICRRADLLVFDNTSAGFEFAATGRPVVVMNAAGYRRNASHGGRFWDWATVGVNANSPADLLPAVERALQDPQDVRDERERTLDLVYSDRRPGAALRAAGAIAAWAESRVEVAA